MGLMSPGRGGSAFTLAKIDALMLSICSRTSGAFMLRTFQFGRITIWRGSLAEVSGRKGLSPSARPKRVLSGIGWFLSVLLCEFECATGWTHGIQLSYPFFAE